MPRPLIHTDFTEPESPCCPHCGGRDLMRGGSANGKKRYKCRGCGRWSYGAALLAPPAHPCPFCGGRCLKDGRSANGSQRYLCTACGKKNTELYPEPPRSPGGPFRHVVTFYLGPAAAKGLAANCNASGMSVAQAVREIFRLAARSPLALVASARTVYDELGRVERIVITRPRVSPTKIVFANERLPDVRREVTRKRMQRTGEEKYLPTVYVDAKISVALDDLAKEGLFRTMRAEGMTHQEAARYLLTHMRLPAKDVAPRHRAP